MLALETMTSVKLVVNFTTVSAESRTGFLEQLKYHVFLPSLESRDEEPGANRGLSICYSLVVTQGS